MISPGVLTSGLVRTIIIMTISGSLLTLLLLLIKPLVHHRLPKSAQYYIWLVVLAALLVPVSRFIALPQLATPIYTIVESNVVSAAEARDRSAATLFVPDTFPSSTTQSIPTYDAIQQGPPGIMTSIITGFMLIYPWVVLAVLLYSIASYLYYTRKLRKSNASAQWVELAVLTDVPDGVTPQAYINPLVTTPMLIGLFKPVILLPKRDYSFAELRSILLHEITHLRRFDIAIKWLSLLACALHWFNPIVWIARRKISNACEFSCDEAVIRSMNYEDKHNYGETLIAVVAKTKTPVSILSSTMSEEKKALKERLISIMKARKHTKLAILFSALIIIAAVVTVSALGASGAADIDAYTEYDGYDTIEYDVYTEYYDYINDAPEPYESYDPIPTPDYPVVFHGSEGGITDSTLHEMIENGTIPLDVTQLTLSFNNEISDLSPLARLPYLQVIELSFNRITDLSPLATLSNLTALYLSNNEIADVSPLADLPNLRTLVLNYNQISDVSPLASLPSLTGLALCSNQLSDISALAAFENLTFLTLSNNNIHDVSPLSGLTNLDDLVLDDNNISDISPLAALTDLQVLVISRNPVYDLRPLASLTNLRSLIAVEAQISNVSPLAGLSGLRNLMLSHNPIVDATPLAALNGLYGLSLRDAPLSQDSIHVLNASLINTVFNHDFDHSQEYEIESFPEPYTSPPPYNGYPMPTTPPYYWHDPPQPTLPPEAWHPPTQNPPPSTDYPAPYPAPPYLNMPVVSPPPRDLGWSQAFNELTANLARADADVERQVLWITGIFNPSTTRADVLRQIGAPPNRVYAAYGDWVMDRFDILTRYGYAPPNVYATDSLDRDGMIAGDVRVVVFIALDEHDLVAWYTIYYVTLDGAIYEFRSSQEPRYGYGPVLYRHDRRF